VKSADPEHGTLEGTVSGGGWITLEITVSAAEGGALLSVVARCDDIWGAGARRGIDQFRQALPSQGDGLALPTPRPAGPPPSLEDGLTLAQKLSVGLFLGLVSVCSLDVAWGRGLFPLSLDWLYLLSAAGGAFAGFMLVKRRYWAIALLAGAVAGLGAVALSIFTFREVTQTYKLVVIATTVLGCLPGVAVLLGLRWLQDRLFPPRPSQRPSE
jgi:hypothetical protein